MKIVLFPFLKKKFLLIKTLASNFENFAMTAKVFEVMVINKKNC